MVEIDNLPQTKVVNLSDGTNTNPQDNIGVNSSFTTRLRLLYFCFFVVPMEKANPPACKRPKSVSLVIWQPDESNNEKRRS